MSDIILILGAQSDIGRAIAHQYAKHGYELYLAARNASRLDADVSDLRIRYGAKARFFEFDALAFDTHKDFYASLPAAPDIVCCVFGVFAETTQTINNWHIAYNIMQVNYVGAVSILEQVAQQMQASQKGTIIGISSIAGDRGRGKNYIYGSSKAAFTAYLSGLRNRLQQYGVHLLTVKPGFVATKMIEGLDAPAALTAEPSQVAQAVYHAAKNKRHVIYSKWIWRYIIWIIRLIPEFIFKKMNI